MAGRFLLMKCISPGEKIDLGIYLKEFVTVVTDYLVDYLPGRNLVSSRIRNPVNGG